MVDEVVIRPATPDDVDAILDVFEATAAEGIWIGTEAPIDRARRQPAFLATVETMQAGGPDAMIVAEVDGRVVGSVGLHGQYPGVLGLGIHIADGHRGRGIGTGLMEAAVAWARDMDGIHKVVLDHFPWNHAGRAIYERAGFVEEGYRRRHFRRKDGSLWDAVCMALVLDEDAPGHEPRAQRPPPYDPGHA